MTVDPRRAVERCESCGVKRTSLKGWLRWEDDVLTCPKCSPTKHDLVLEAAEMMADTIAQALYAMRADGAGCLRGRVHFDALKIALHTYTEALSYERTGK
jgi:hypothetical protein